MNIPGSAIGLASPWFTNGAGFEPQPAPVALTKGFEFRRALQNGVANLSVEVHRHDLRSCLTRFSCKHCQGSSGGRSDRSYTYPEFVFVVANGTG